MSSSYEKVFSKTKKEPSMTFARRREPPARSANPKLKEMLEEVLEALNALGSRLDAIERIEKDVKEIKEVLSIGKFSLDANKPVK